MGRHDEQIVVRLAAPPPSQDVRPRSVRSPDVLEGAAGEDLRSRRWPARGRGLVTGAALLVLAALCLLAVDRVRAWQDERALRDRVSVDAELGVDASSWAWTPTGRGRVEYFLVLRNSAPRPARMSRVLVEHPGLSITGRALSRAPVPPGEVAYVPLDVELDCRRWRPPAGGSALDASVAVVAASGRTAQVPVAVGRSRPLTGVVRMLCSLDPELRIADLSGPVQVPR